MTCFKAKVLGIRASIYMNLGGHNSAHHDYQVTSLHITKGKLFKCGDQPKTFKETGGAKMLLGEKHGDVLLSLPQPQAFFRSLQPPPLLLWVQSPQGLASEGISQAWLYLLLSFWTDVRRTSDAEFYSLVDIVVKVLLVMTERDKGMEVKRYRDSGGRLRLFSALFFNFGP